MSGKEPPILPGKIREIIELTIRRHKSAVADELKDGLWQKLDSSEMAEEAEKKITELIELYLYLPCCHVSGTHDPRHFEERTSICNRQESEAMTRFCKALGINPVTRSDPECGWCKDYPEKRKGEGMRLFN